MGGQYPRNSIARQLVTRACAAAAHQRMHQCASARTSTSAWRGFTRCSARRIHGALHRCEQRRYAIDYRAFNVAHDELRRVHVRYRAKKNFRTKRVSPGSAPRLRQPIFERDFAMCSADLACSTVSLHPLAQRSCSPPGEHDYIGGLPAVSMNTSAKTGFCMKTLVSLFSMSYAFAVAAECTGRSQVTLGTELGPQGPEG